MKKVKNLKPTEIDLHIKYSCPNKSCKNDHWATLKESQTKNFIMVCECGYIIKPKRIDKVKIVYHKTNTTKKIIPKENTIIPKDILSKSIPMMVALGYSEEEAFRMLTSYYSHNPITDYKALVKNSIAISNGRYLDLVSSYIGEQQ
jgi:hypothetical protein